MLHRAFRYDGQWVDVVFATDGDEFSTSAEANAADVAEALGVPAADVEVVDGPADPRSGSLIALPAAPSAPDPDDALRSAIEAATDFASLKAALLGSKAGQAARVAGRPKGE